MTISFTNIWKDKILDQLSSIITDEFGNQINVYIGDVYMHNGNCSLRLFGTSQALTDNMTNSFTNSYAVDIVYYILAPNYNDTIIDKFYRDISRIEQLINNNIIIADGWHDGRIDGIEINSFTENEEGVDGLFSATINFVCSYTKVF